MTGKVYLSTPLPFVGQKRILVRGFIKVSEQFPRDTVFVDLFGGSGLLSHIMKYRKPDATVVYNDSDNYRCRIAHIPQTNRLIADVRGMVEDTMPYRRPITGELHECILRRTEQEKRTVGYVDSITLSSSLVFSMKYRLSVPKMRREALYNSIRKADHPEYADYLDGLEIVSYNYKEAFGRYRDTPGVVFLIGLLYLPTDVGTYNIYWHMLNYLGMLSVLAGHSFAYFTSNKSFTLELCEWIGGNQDIGNPFEKCTRVEFSAHMDYNTLYTDMVPYRKGAA